MKKYKIAVYAICKNEEQFVKRFMKTAKEADLVVVLDTGSTDDTVDALRREGATVYQETFSPWRFDVARNRSLQLVPEDVDICVCMDLDEVIRSGWRKKLKPATVFYIQKIHTRNNYIWTHPVHEVLTYIKEGQEQIKHTEDIIIDHHPDVTKSRSSYLPLLELSVKEDPEDDRNMHYLGREYMYYERWNDCIDTLIKHLSLPRATWKEERAASIILREVIYI